MPSVVDDQETAEMERLIKCKVPGTRAFVAKQGVCGRSTILVGNDKIGWTQALVCYQGDHRARARAYCNRFNNDT